MVPPTLFSAEKNSDCLSVEDLLMETAGLEPATFGTYIAKEKLLYEPNKTRLYDALSS